MPLRPEAHGPRGLGLAPQARLRREADFKYVFAGAVRAADGTFTVLGRSNGLGSPRLGLAISAKMGGNAVSRNRIKRAVRETFRIIQHDLAGVDVIVMARRDTRTKTGAEMRASLRKLLRSISKKCAHS